MPALGVGSDMKTSIVSEDNFVKLHIGPRERKKFVQDAAQGEPPPVSGVGFLQPKSEVSVYRIIMT